MKRLLARQTSAHASYLVAGSIASFFMIQPAFAAPIDAGIETKVDALVSEMNDQLGVLPGFSIAIVQGDQVILEKGYGFGNLETGTAFTADTSSYIASATKAMFGLMVAQLAHRGALDLDAPIGPTYLSDMDQDTLGLITTTSLRQLLSHTHGINMDAMTFRASLVGDYTDEEMWAAIKAATPMESGHDFVYSNTGYIIASFVLEHIFKEDWQKLVEREVLMPLGMTHTLSKVSDLIEADLAKPYMWFGASLRLPNFKRDDTMHAAGGHFSTARDLSRWLIANLNEGKIDGEQIITPQAIRATQNPIASLNATFYQFSRTGYGLGWYTSDYEGNTLLHHFGSLSGYRTHISMMPDLDLGIAIMANDFSRATGNLPDMIAAMIYDTALDREGIDAKYTAEIAELATMVNQVRGRTMPERPRNAPADETSFIGTYHNDILGSWEVRQDDNVIRVFWGNLDSDIIYVDRDDTKLMRVEFAGQGYFVRILRDESGAISGFSYRENVLQKVR